MKSKKHKYILNARKLGSKNFRSIGWKTTYRAAKNSADILIKKNTYEEIKISRSTLVKIIKKKIKRPSKVF